MIQLALEWASGLIHCKGSSRQKIGVIYKKKKGIDTITKIRSVDSDIF